MPDIYEIGEGVRGCKDRSEFLFYNPNKVYMKCLICSFEWSVSSFEWHTFIPTECPECSLSQISHSWIVLNSIPYKWGPTDIPIVTISIPINLKSRYWTINHNLSNSIINVQCISDNEAEIIPDQISYIDNNNLLIDFGINNIYFGTCICYPIYDHKVLELKQVTDPIRKACIKTLIRVKRF